MHTGRAVLAYPETLRMPWYESAAVAAASFAKYLALTLAVVAGGTLLLALLLLALVLGAPLLGALVVWVLWLSARGRASEARALRRARALRLRLVRDA